MINNIIIGIMVIAKMLCMVGSCLLGVLFLMMSTTVITNDVRWARNLLCKTIIKVNSL